MLINKKKTYKEEKKKKKKKRELTGSLAIAKRIVQKVTVLQSDPHSQQVLYKLNFLTLLQSIKYILKVSM
jgi:hypothetical protein